MSNVKCHMSVWPGWPLTYFLDNFCDLDLVLKVKKWIKF